MPHGLSDMKDAFTLPFLTLSLFKDNAGSAATPVAPSDGHDAAQHRTLSPFSYHPHTDPRSLHILYAQNFWAHKFPARQSQYTHGMASYTRAFSASHESNALHVYWPRAGSPRPCVHADSSLRCWHSALGLWRRRRRLIVSLPSPYLCGYMPRP